VSCGAEILHCGAIRRNWGWASVVWKGNETARGEWFDRFFERMLESMDVAEVAQLVEQPIRNRQVPGSSPGLGSIRPLSFCIVTMGAPRRIRLQCCEAAFAMETSVPLPVKDAMDRQR
jgi:hypothetical protein